MDKNQPNNTRRKNKGKRTDEEIEKIKIQRKAYNVKYRAKQKERENQRIQELELVKTQLQAAQTKIQELEVENSQLQANQTRAQESKLKVKKSALKRMARRIEIEHLKKLGKMVTK